MRHSIFIMILLLVATSVWAGTRFYDFEDENQIADWYRGEVVDDLPYTVQWYVENGELIFSSDNICGWAQGLSIGDDTWRDYVFEGQFRIEQTFSPPCSTTWGRAVVFTAYWHYPDGETDPAKAWMVWFGLNNRGTWNSMIVGVGSSDNYRFVAGSPYTMDPPVEEKRWYSFRIENQGNHYKMFLDNEIVSEFEVGSPEDAYGAPGVVSRNCEVHFDNIVITGDSVPDMNVATGGSSTSKLAITWGQVKASK